MQYQWKCSQEAPALQEKHAEGRRTEVLSGAHTIVQELCHVAYVWLLMLCPNACTLPLCAMLWSVLQEQFFCPITDGFFHSFQKMTSLLAGCCTSFATGWDMSLDGCNLLRLMFRLLTVAFLPQFRSWRGVVVRADRSMPFSLVLPSACPAQVQSDEMCIGTWGSLCYGVLPLPWGHNEPFWSWSGLMS